MKKYQLLVFVFVLLSPGLSLWAKDFGLILDQNGSYSGMGFSNHSNNVAEYKASLIPRFQALIGNRGDLYISAGIIVEYVDEEWNYLPELLRTEFSWLFDKAALRAGRMHYSDPLGFIAEGLFDGARVSLDTGVGTFSAGAWYTGFLYKRRSEIAMNAYELVNYHDKVDYNDFANTYFAPRRFLSALDWEHPSLGGGLLRGRLSLLGQIDLNDEVEEINSYYFSGKLSLPVNAFLFDLGGSLGLIQATGFDTKLAFAAEASAGWMLATSFPSRLSLLCRYSSGVSSNDNYVAFVPVTTQPHGYILEANISGLTMISLDYIARLHRTFSLSLSSSYFIRNDLGTYNASSLFGGRDADKGYFLGNEFFSWIFWSPASDLSINFGCGIFLPSLGNVATSADNLWKVALNLTLSLF